MVEIIDGDKILGHERIKRQELMWALVLQEYTAASIARIFGVHRATALRIIRKKPRDWSPKWVKKG